MTPLQSVYDAFLANIEKDDWNGWDLDEKLEDFYQLLLSGIPNFKFPKIDLTIKNDYFVNTLTNDEIQILASYMKITWLNRSILTYENLASQYNENDYSPANVLQKLSILLKQETEYVKNLERIYYRRDNGKPYDYSKLCGKS